MESGELRFANLNRRQALLVALARILPYVNPTPGGVAGVAASGVAVGAVAAALGMRPAAALPLGFVVAWLGALSCNVLHRVVWGRDGLPPPSGPGNPGGDFEPRDPLVPAGGGAAEMPLPEAEEQISAITESRTLSWRRRAR